jgi:hypothetical protein
VDGQMALFFPVIKGIYINFLSIYY